MNYGIVVSRFNEDVVEPLLAECLRGFKEQGIVPEVVRVAGAVEIPLAAQDLILGKEMAAIVALGCVIKGDTDHYDAVCRMCEQGLMEVMLSTHTPIVFEVLMVDEKQKALDRIPKGYEAAFVAKEMGTLIRKHAK